MRFCILTAQTPNRILQRPSTMSLSPWFRFPDASREDQAENHASDGDSLADMPCEVEAGKVNNDRNGNLSKWNQQFPKTTLVSAEGCAG